MIGDNPELFDFNQSKSRKETKEAQILIGSRKDEEDDDEYELVKVEDIQHSEEDESLSLEKKEKEMIIKALARNNNKRKYAAADLGISERTLYRKIKQYEIN